MTKNTDILFLFDVDGTLSPSREKAPSEIIAMLKHLKKHINIAFVGGSDLPKQVEQIGEDCLEIFDYGFPENGVQFYKNGKIEKSDDIIKHIGEKRYMKIVNHILYLLSKAKCPVKRGTFIELRRSMINVSPVGRSCSKDERVQFFEYDKKHETRKKLCAKMSAKLKKYGLQAVIGGQISIDIFPQGWDKTHCLQHVKESKIVFFGDMTEFGGNDFEIYNHHRVSGIRVNGPEDTLKRVNEELEKLGIEEFNISEEMKKLGIENTGK
ncbi:phosphomannomutase [Pancytospora epiphaga]|nr:phosphomannomutase [Pancytospora epiphaga]